MKSRFGQVTQFVIIGLTILLMACNSSKVIAPEGALMLDPLKVKPSEDDIYRASRKKKIDILHTKLNLSIEWDSAYLHGLATITLKPYFYPINQIELDARGFRIHEVAELIGEDKKGLQYSYDEEDIIIDAGRELTNKDTIVILIKYTAMPNKLKEGGSAAITSDKGLYFINEDNSDPKKPRQLWTQGETEANSCWFPTVDSPNERFTHEIYVTIEEDYTSISNGLKMFSVNNNDGTKTEYWNMDKPNTAYLVMLAVGPFAVYEDEWNNMEVNYYLDSAYLKYAGNIFGNTPEMLNFYSDYLGVPYPWQKYDQVVVHDYVSGAMENTTATIHGEFLQRTKRELIDNNNEDVIAHELFHQWFGDLVTCESWSNLTLNEGFATYGEYLWEEYKYGRDEADFNFSNNKVAYMYEARDHNVDMIRFYYNNKEDMFDSHSYSKGGLILHMLRNYVGDDAFRASLKHYLTKHAYSDVEIHDLRLAFEEITGEDLNWFFNQWFLASGHPVLELSQFYNPESKIFSLVVSQEQDTEKFPVYRLPVEVLIKSGGKIIEKEFIIEDVKDTLSIEMDQKPEYINFDPGSSLLAEITFDQDASSRISLYLESDLGIDKIKALDAIMLDTTYENYAFFEKVLKHDHWQIRHAGLQYFTREHDKNQTDSTRSILFDLARNDKDWKIRYQAIDYLKDYYDDNEMTELVKRGIDDSSIWVSSVSISALSQINKEEAAKIIPAIEDLEYSGIASAVAGYYMDNGSARDHEKLIEIMNQIDDYGQYRATINYGKYLDSLELTDLFPAMDYLKETSLHAGKWWVRMAAINVTIKVHERLKENWDGIIEGIKMDVQENEEFSGMEDESAKIGLLYAMTDDILQQVKEKETRENLISIVDDYLTEK